VEVGCRPVDLASTAHEAPSPSRISPGSTAPIEKKMQIGRIKKLQLGVH
jgi:hypothetical protein